MTSCTGDLKILLVPAPSDRICEVFNPVYLAKYLAEGRMLCIVPWHASTMAEKQRPACNA